MQYSLNSLARFQQRTWIELNADAFYRNFAQLVSCAAPARFGVVVKANGYGHGMREIASLVSACSREAWLCVAGSSEGVLLRSWALENPILAMSYLDSDPEAVITADLALVAYDLATIQKLNAAGIKLKKPARLHIKIDTSMSRLGITPQELGPFLDTVCGLPGVVVEALFTHLCDTNNPDVRFTLQQFAAFDQALEIATAVLGRRPFSHVLASGSLMFAQKYDLVRVGTTLFGYWKSALQKERFETVAPDIALEPVLWWKTKIIQIKTISAGTPVGYNCAFVAPHAMKIATIPVGYVDGLPRALSGFGMVSVAGQLVPLLGIISMNLAVIDITKVPHVAVGHEVVLLGDVPGVTAVDHATSMGTIANELLARLSPDIPRYIITGGSS